MRMTPHKTPIAINGVPLPKPLFFGREKAVMWCRRRSLKSPFCPRVLSKKLNSQYRNLCCNRLTNLNPSIGCKAVLDNEYIE